jgi:hypothetical protein
MQHRGNAEILETAVACCLRHRLQGIDTVGYVAMVAGCAEGLIGDELR